MVNLHVLSMLHSGCSKAVRKENTSNLGYDHIFNGMSILKLYLADNQQGCTKESLHPIFLCFLQAYYTTVIRIAF